jgi:Tol biopolymer transport system component
MHVATGLALTRFPDGGSASQVFVVEADGGLLQLTGSGPASSRGASLPVWSPDRSQLAFGPPKVSGATARFLSVVDADGTNERPLAMLGDEFGLPFAWSSDGASLLYFVVDAADGPAMWLVDVPSGDVRHLGIGQGPRWLSDTRWISFQQAVEGRDPVDPRALTQVIYLMNVDDGEVIELAEASAATWAPDGSAVLLELADGSLVLADADGSDRRDLGRGFAPAWSPDGTRIALGVAHSRVGVPLLAVIDRAGVPIWSGLPGTSPSWSPDGTRLAVEDPYPSPTVKVVDARTGEVLWRTDGADPSWNP